MKSKNDSDQITVIARAPFNIYYEGPAKMVSANNKVGRFDILPGHADFFSMMSAGEVVIETETEDVSFKITNGIIAVRDNEAMLFVNM